MKPLSRSYLEILHLAARSRPGPKLPAPDGICDDVADLMANGLLSVIRERVQITGAGEAALNANAGRITEIEKELRLDAPG